MTIKPIFSVFAIGFLVLLAPNTHSWATGKKMKKAAAQYDSVVQAYHTLQQLYLNCRDSDMYYNTTSTSLRGQVNDQQNQLKDQKANNDQILNHLKDLSVLSSSQAESINRFLTSIGEKDSYIRNLQEAISRKDSMTMALAMNLKSAIGNVDDKDINIKIDKGVIYVDISDKMLFKTGKYEVAGTAKAVLGKVAAVLQAHPDIDFMVEGHTDNVPFTKGLLLDNWDLSVKRATAVVRILQTEYGVSPTKMTAAGRSEYLPVAANTTEDGKAQNRRTRIIILPQLDQFFSLLQKTK
jgi:chemotaxis protein MotB